MIYYENFNFLFFHFTFCEEIKLKTWVKFGRRWSYNLCGLGSVANEQYNRLNSMEMNNIVSNRIKDDWLNES